MLRTGALVAACLVVNTNAITQVTYASGATIGYSAKDCSGTAETTLKESKTASDATDFFSEKATTNDWAAANNADVAAGATKILTLACANGVLWINARVAATAYSKTTDFLHSCSTACCDMTAVKSFDGSTATWDGSKGMTKLKSFVNICPTPSSSSVKTITSATAVASLAALF